jgi:hypothetical protein
MIHQKLVDDFLTRRNHSKCKKPFSETVHILHLGSKYDWYSMITLGVVEFTRVEQIREYVVLIFNYSILAVAWGRRKFPPLSNVPPFFILNIPNQSPII